MSIENKKREFWIDSLKGFSIILVVLGHVIGGYQRRGSFASSQPVFHDIYNFIYSFHMPLFFIISGFLFSYAYTRLSNNARTLDRARFRSNLFNTIIVYFVFSLLLGTLKIFFNNEVAMAVEPLDLLLVWLKPIQLYWYLYVLILCYFIFSRKNLLSYKIAIPILIVLAIISSVAYYLPSTNILTITLNKRPESI